MIGEAWRRDWTNIIPFLALPDGLRKAVYTTNTIEGLHRQIRKAIKTRGHFPDQQAATKLIYLAIIRSESKWQSNRAWTTARAGLKIHAMIRKQQSVVMLHIRLDGRTELGRSRCGVANERHFTQTDDDFRQQSLIKRTPGSCETGGVGGVCMADRLHIGAQSVKQQVHQ